MDLKIAEEFLDELFSSLEAQETQGAAILQYLKDHGDATEEQLAPYMEQASKASNVRWRAARLRLMSLLSSAVKSSEEASAKGSQPEPEGQELQQKTNQKASHQEKPVPEDNSKKQKAPSPPAKKASESSPSEDKKPKVADEDRSRAEASRKVVAQADTSQESPPSRDEAAEATEQDRPNAEASRKTASQHGTSKESSRKPGKDAA